MDILEILGKIGFDTRVFLFNLINFVIVALILWKFFFKKMVATMEQRQKELAEGFENAEKAKNELAMSNQRAKEIISDAKSEANQIVKQAVDKAKEAEVKLKQSAEEEVVQLKSKAQEQIKQERAKMLDDFKSEATDLVLLATQKLVSQSSDSASKEDVKKYLDSINLKNN